MARNDEHEGSRSNDHQGWGRGIPWVVLLAAVLVGCASTTFVSTWKAPGVAPIDPKGNRVAAVVMMKSEAGRRAAEDRLAQELSRNGAQGIASYRIVPTINPGEEAQAKAALEAQNVQSVVVMRPMGVDKELHVYSDPMYGGYWGGYYGYGWGHPYGASVDTYVDTHVAVETLVYSLTQNKLLWGGQSKTTNPENVEQLVVEIAQAAADEMRAQGLLVPAAP